MMTFESGIDDDEVVVVEEEEAAAAAAEEGLVGLLEEAVDERE